MPVVAAKPVTLSELAACWVTISGVPPRVAADAARKPVPEIVAVKTPSGSATGLNEVMAGEG